MTMWIRQDDTKEHGLRTAQACSRQKPFWYTSSTASGPPSPIGEGKRKDVLAIPLPWEVKRGRHNDTFTPAPRKGIIPLNL